MDDDSVHVRNDVMAILTEAKVRVIILAPHTTQIFQVLVLTLFGVPERCARYELPFDDDNATVKVIMKIYHNFPQAMVPSSVWKAFLAIGLEFDTRREPHRLLFDKEKLRGSAGFQELWYADCPLDQLSGQRPIAPFGWINKPE
jgi:hypothetical protein